MSHSPTKSPPTRRRSIFTDDVIPPDPRVFVLSHQQGPTVPPTQERASTFPRSISPSSIASSTLLDHRAYPPTFPPTRRMSTAAYVADDNTDSDDMLLPSELAVNRDKRNMKRMRRNESIALDSELSSDRYMLRDRRRSVSSTHSVDHNRSGVRPRASEIGETSARQANDGFLIDIDENEGYAPGNTTEALQNGSNEYDSSSAPRSRNMSTTSLDDVCVPMENQDFVDATSGKQKIWPDISTLVEWSATEQETSTPGTPDLVMVDGRPRYESGTESPAYYLEDNTVVPERRRRSAGAPREPSRNPSERLGYPFRFTYFREDLEKTIHAQTISGLLGHGMSFSDLFPVSPDIVPSSVGASVHSSSSEEVPEVTGPDEKHVLLVPEAVQSRPHSAPPEQGQRPSLDNMKSYKTQPSRTPSYSQDVRERPYPFWLDILDPTDAEMKVLSKTFGIHPLTTEDICMEETREKVELFRTYYLVCFRSFELEPHMSARERRLRFGNDPAKRRNNFGQKGDLIPVNIYVVVFRDGILTFHYRPTPHPSNVRKRIRQLRDYVTVSADWICYAIIDNVTDAFAPLIGEIEEEVQDIDTEILEMNSGHLSQDDDDDSVDFDHEDFGHKLHRRLTGATDASSVYSGRTTTKRFDARGKHDMLRRIGECRTQVMSLMRLLGYKADVIKGFAKRCNEQWEIAPRSEIGLYLGDIQDHIITMVQNLTHYEKLLSRTHSNYLAQINIAMTQVNNDTNDVLGRLTILGTIVLPMNIITGLWGMNVYVPGQDQEGLVWFYSITLGLIVFGLVFFVVAKKIYGLT
ncbi:hypothetical protein V1525DRAFT_394231 [Lipomyces kononenkoae]|uniref:Uncharacterized protein n=1 Tax=Lipomyces kononenkoae TaxID=34357 RepID=A0ACC3TB76_LIPKO